MTGSGPRAGGDPVSYAPEAPGSRSPRSDDEHVGLGLFGGTFDPVHYGHLRAADEVRVALRLADMRLLPAGDPPHREPPGASAEHRLAMLKLALREFPQLSIDDREVRRSGKSYTVLTLTELRGAMPATPIVLVTGADAFLGLPTWHRWREIFALAHVVVVTRPGVALADLPPGLRDEWQARHTNDRLRLESSPAGAILDLAVAPHDMSATAIRAALAAGPTAKAQLDGLLPPAVLTYIDHHQLYRPRKDA
jgi:nicotinate-nucleotide adenylyltransferase